MNAITERDTSGMDKAQDTAIEKEANAAKMTEVTNQKRPRTGRPRVVIVGAGFGGLNAARALAGKGVDVLVMRAGRIVEDGSVDDVFTSPKADYTRALLDAIPGRAA